MTKTKQTKLPAQIILDNLTGLLPAPLVTWGLLQKASRAMGVGMEVGMGVA